jgi:LysM repeat protein
VTEKSSPVTTKAADLYGTQEYQTVAGESWQTVARDFGTTVDVLRHYNGAVSGTELAPGTFLRVPASKYENSADLR